MATSELKVVAGGTTAPGAAPRALPCVQLPCPICGEPRANLSLNLWTLEDSEGHFTCCECNGEFTLDVIRNVLRAWGPFVAWIESIPTPAAE